MRANLFGILFLLLSSFTANAQQQPFPTWAQDPTWSVLECVYGIGCSCNTEVFQFTDSIDMCGHSYSILSSPGDSTYFRNEGQRTLFRRSTDCLEKEYLIYDYSIAVGDTLFTGLNMDWSQADTAMFVLQAIDTIQLSGTARRRLLMKYDRCNEGNLQAYSTMHWVEGIGSTRHPFYPLACICDFCESGQVLLCHDSASVQLYQDTVLNTCDTTFVGLEEHEAETTCVLRAWQGPGGDAILLQFRGDGCAGSAMDRTLSILDMDGKLVRVFSLPNGEHGPITVPLHDMARGIYYLEASTGGTRISSTRVVIE
jgi:hypothetical protein